MFCAILILVATAVVGAFAPSRFLEVEQDLRDAAQMKCATRAEYTTVDNQVLYVDHATEKDKLDYMLEGGTGRVVLATYPKNVIPSHLALPITLTGTNIGIGLGMTNNTPQAVILASMKQEIDPQFPLRHVQQNASFCVQMSQVAELGVSSFYQHMKDDYKQSYLTILKTALLHANGFVALDCGYIQNRMGCFNRVRRLARLWRANITSTIKSSPFRTERNAWRNVSTLGEALGGNVPIYDEVFVIDSMYDYNFHHVLVDSVARLIPFCHYLRRHPHIKIHIRRDEMVLNVSRPVSAKKFAAAPVMRQRVFDLLGFAPERIVSGALIARKLYLPNDIECMSPLRHALGLQQLAKLLQTKARKVVKLGRCGNPQPVQRKLVEGRAHTLEAKKDRVRKPFRWRKDGNKRSEVVLPPTGANGVLQVHDCVIAPAAANVTRTYWRCLTDSQRQQLRRASEEVFPQSNIVVASTALSTPLACDIALYRSAHVVIGVHGAAMTNAMFMRPGTVLVEIVGQFDLRMPPVCGFYGPFSTVFGVHHFQYYYDGVLDADSLNIVDVVRQAHDFYNNIRARIEYTDYSLAYGRYDYNVSTKVGSTTNLFQPI